MTDFNKIAFYHMMMEYHPAAVSAARTCYDIDHEKNGSEEDIDAVCD